MIPYFDQFIAALHAKKKVCVRFFSNADAGVLDRVCAPMDYGAVGESKDGLNRYWLWDYGSKQGAHTLCLLPQQIMDLRVLGENFDPAQLDMTPPQWSIPRNWSSPLRIKAAPDSAQATLTAAPRTVGGQEQRSETPPANKE